MTFFARQIRNLLPLRTAVLGLVGLKECAHQQFDPKQRIRDEIDEVLERFRMTRRLPGMEVMIFKGGEEFYRQAFGVKDRENNNVLYAQGTTVPYGPICGCYVSLLCLIWLQSNSKFWTEKIKQLLSEGERNVVTDTKLIAVLLERWGNPSGDRDYEKPLEHEDLKAKVFKTQFILNHIFSNYQQDQTTQSCAFCFEIIAHWIDISMVNFEDGMKNFLAKTDMAENVRLYNPSVRHKNASFLYISQKDSSDNYVYTNRFYEDWSRLKGMDGLEGDVEGLAKLGNFVLDCLKPTSDTLISYRNMKDMLEKNAFYQDNMGILYEGRSMGWKIKARKGGRNLWNVDYTADGIFAYLHISRTNVPSFDYTGLNSLDNFQLDIKLPDESLGQPKASFEEPSSSDEPMQENNDCDRNNVVIAMTSNIKIKLADALMQELCALVRSADGPDDD